MKSYDVTIPALCNNMIYGIVTNISKENCIIRVTRQIPQPNYIMLRIPEDVYLLGSQEILDNRYIRFKFSDKCNAKTLRVLNTYLKSLEENENNSKRKKDDPKKKDQSKR